MKFRTPQPIQKHGKKVKNSFLKPPGNKFTQISDSHGRDLIYHLDNQLSNKFLSFGLVLPTAQLENVISATEADKKIETFTKSDYVIWIADTNDRSRNYKQQLDLNIEKDFILKIKDKIDQFSHTNLILDSIPYRYDLPEDSQENQIIWSINDELKSLTIKYSHLLWLDLWLLPRHFYTRQGVHFNKQGKRSIAHEIKMLIEEHHTFSKRNKNFSPSPFTKCTVLTEKHMAESI